MLNAVMQLVVQFEIGKWKKGRKGTYFGKMAKNNNKNKNKEKVTSKTVAELTVKNWIE